MNTKIPIKRVGEYRVKNFRKTTLSVVIGLLTGGMGAHQVYAQSSNDPSQGPEIEEVIITGSRIRTGTTVTPVPVTAISQDDLLAASPANLADGLKQLPAIEPGGGPTAGGGTRAGGQQFLSLRGLGSDRNLILLNGRRMVMADPLNRVDINLIPQSLVSRVDVVTGGASAAYGSDAVAGVVNFVLDNNFEGFKVDAYRGISAEGDNDEYKISPTFGFSALDEKLHVVGSVERVLNEGVSGDQRSFRTTSPNQIQDPNNTSMLIRANDLRAPFTYGGLVVTGRGGSSAANAKFQGINFVGPNSTAAYDYGKNSTTVGSTRGSQDGGDGHQVSTGQEIVRPLERTNGFLGLSYDVTDSIKVFSEIVYADTFSDYESSPNRATFDVSVNNPYLAAAAPDVVASMKANGVTSLRMNRLLPELGTNVSDNSNKTSRFLFGIEGGKDNWVWDVVVQTGKNTNEAPTRFNQIPDNLDRAINATRDSNGTIVCADTLSNDPSVVAAAVGCSPMNPFGAGSPSAASTAYSAGTSYFETTNEQDAAEANISGDLFEMPSGDSVFGAFGIEWRDIRAKTVVDEGSLNSIYRLVNQQPFDASYSVKEAYAEFQVPLLSGLKFVESLDLNIAGRVTDYSTSGKVNTWKASISWQVTDDLRLRSTLSADIRAASLEELYASGRQNNTTIVDRETGQTYLQVPNKTFGNPNLVPEEASTKVIGFVYQPSWFEGFDLAIDYFHVKIEQALQNIGGGTAVDLCFENGASSPACDLVVRDPTNNAVIGTFTSPINLATQTVSGVDIEAAYKTTLPWEIGGDLTLRFLGGYLDQNLLESPLIGNPLNTVGSARDGSQPHFRGNLSVRYDRDALGLYVQTRYIDSMTWDKSLILGVDTDFNYIGSEVYVDAEARYTFNFADQELQVYLNVANLLDKGLVYSPSTGGSTPLPTDTGLYDQVGRMYRLGARYSF